MPIWKQEHWSGGSDWAVEQHPIRRVESTRVEAERLVAFLLFAIAASAVGIVFVLMRNRRPTTMEHSIDEFERGLACARAGVPGAARRVRTSRRRGVLPRDLAIDLGTANTLVYARGRGIILNEPTVIALNSRTQDVLAMGQEAWQMIGRTPGYIVAVRPLRGGAITDFEITQRMIRLLFQRAGVNRLYRARVLICVPSAITHVEQRAVLEAARRAGAAQTYLIEQPMAAAIGAGLPIHEPMGNMIVDIGGGTTEVAVISLGGVVALEAVRVGSFDIDAAIQTYVRREYGIAIGERTAEEIKLAIGSASAVEDEIQGRGARPRPDVRPAEDDPARARRGARRDRGAGGRDLRRGDRLPVADAAGARAGSDPQRRPPRRAAAACCAGSTAACRRRRICPCISSTRRSSASCSAPDAASRTSTASKRCSWRAPPRADRLATSRSRFVSVADVEQVFGVLADLPVGVLERAAERGFDLVAVERGEREDRAAADRRLVGAAVRAPPRGRPGPRARRARRPPTSRTRGSACSTAAATSAGTVAAAASRSFTERERGRFGDPRVVVAQQDQQRLDRHRVAERGCRLRGSPADDRASGSSAAASHADARRDSAHRRARVLRARRRGPARLGVVLDQLGQLPVDVGRSSARHRARRAAAARRSRASSGAVTPSTVANLCHIGAPRSERCDAHGRLEGCGRR